MNRITLHEEFRLIERSESEVNGVWKGAHLLLFFLAFVFGSFCTFCFHMLMYLFDEKCVLFPKLLSLTSMKQNILNSFLAENEDPEALPVDFVSTQWVEKSACYLPTYVPLVSGIFGLVWTTMFLMCSSGSRTLTGLQQPWRIIPPVFIFSLAMGCLCTYTSIVTYNGLQELCLKLGEITGTKTCTFAVNVATLAYERRIRGVYQATRLTIFTAWMHTACWLLAALLALIRVLLVVDFRLVRVRAELRGNVDKMLERHEQHLRTVSPDFKSRDEYTSMKPSTSFVENATQSVELKSLLSNGVGSVDSIETIHYVALKASSYSDMALVPEEKIKIYDIESKNYKFITQILDDILNGILRSIEGSSSLDWTLTFGFDSTESEPIMIRQQAGQWRISSEQDDVGDSSIQPEEAEARAEAFRQLMRKKITSQPPSKKRKYSSTINMTPELQRVIGRRTDRHRSGGRKRSKKSNLKAKGNQTENRTKTKGTQPKVHIAESSERSPHYSSASLETLKPMKSEGYISPVDDALISTEDQVSQTQQDTVDKETQAPSKEKQD